MKNKKYIILFLLVLISMGFAYLSTNLNISGSSLIKGNSWDVHFENVAVDSKSVSLSTGDSAPSISVDGLTITFEVTLYEPGDLYRFDADIVNDGTLDAMIEQFNVNGLSQYEDFIECNVTYEYGQPVRSYDLLEAGETRKIHVEAKYKDDITADDLEENDSEISLSISAKYVQADSYAREIPEVKQFFVSGRNMRLTYNYVDGTTWQEWLNNPYCNIDSIHYYISDYFQTEVISFGENGWIVQSIQGRIIENHTYSLDWAECVSPYSNIIVNLNGDTKLAKDININDSIVYHDFETNKELVGKVAHVFMHEKANSFVKYYFEDNTYLDVTDYHPLYTLNGWRSYTNRNGYASPIIGDQVKTLDGYKKLTRIEPFNDIDDYYDFLVIDENGNKIKNYYANNTLVEGSY